MRNKTDFFWKCLWVSLAFHLVTAFFSVGHHSADEYFQILEFVNFKLGGTPLKDMPVELGEQMRPWMQPWICWLISKAWLFLGMRNPFVWACSIRVFSGLLGWASLVALAFAAREWFKDPKALRLALLSIAGLWYLPVFHVRPSSESWSGSMIVLALALSFLETRRKETRLWAWLGIGAIYGFAFEFRFQVGLMIPGALVWLFLKGRRTFGELAVLVGGIALALGAGRLVDHWGYGSWAISPWRYLSYNLIRGEVFRYGNTPWWDLFRMSVTETWPLLGIFLLLSLIAAWIRHPKHILTWAQVPFFLVHEMISHKELRFFFPLASAGPALLTLSLYSERTGKLLALNMKKLWARLARGFWWLMCANNSIALVILAFMPLSRSVLFWQKLYDLVPPGAKHFRIYTWERDPFEVLGTATHFYRHPALEFKAFKSAGELELALREQGEIYIFQPALDLPKEAKLMASRCTAAYRTLPPFLAKLESGNWKDRFNAWSLFRCRSQRVLD